MNYKKEFLTKNGKICLLRAADKNDAGIMIEVFRKTHEESDFLASYPDEMTMTVESEGEFLDGLYKSNNGIEVLAFVDGKAVGSAGISPVGKGYKRSHRAEFGVSVFSEFQGQGIGKALTAACIECAKTAGYSQVELEVVADNKVALSLYKSFGFIEFGRNPRAFRSRYSGWQENILMWLVLDE